MSNYISSQAVIANTLRKYKLRSINPADMLESIGETIGLLGYGTGNSIQYTTNEINFYKIDYPCDYLEILNIFYNGKVLGDKTLCLNKQEGHSALEFLRNEIVSAINTAKKTKDISEELENIIEGDSPKDILIRDILDGYETLNKFNSINQSIYWKDYRPLNIDTNIEQGQVVIQYLDFLKDSKGFPFIINEVRYLQALEWTIVCDVIISGYEHPTIDIKTAVDMKEKAIKKAENYNRRFTPISAKNFTKSWTNILHNISNSDSLYTN